MFSFIFIIVDELAPYLLSDFIYQHHFDEKVYSRFSMRRGGYRKECIKQGIWVRITMLETKWAHHGRVPLSMVGKRSGTQFSVKNQALWLQQAVRYCVVFFHGALETDPDMKI